MTQQEYQEMKQKEKLLEEQLAHIQEEIKEFENKKIEEEISSFIGHCYAYAPGFGSECLMFRYDEDNDIVYCVEVNKEDDEICISSERRASLKFYKSHEISREEFLRDYRDVLANIERYMNKGIPMTGGENDNM